MNMDSKAKTFHANMLKLYINRDNDPDVAVRSWMTTMRMVNLIRIRAIIQDTKENKLC